MDTHFIRRFLTGTLLPFAATPALAQTGSATTRTSVIERRDPAIPDTGRMAELRRASLERARIAMGRIRTIKVTPDTLRLEAGSRLSAGSYRAVALDSAGREVTDFVPLWGVADNDIARFEGPGSIVGLSSGVTYLRVTATVPGQQRVPGEVRLMAQLTLIVTEAASPIPRAPTDSVPRDLVIALLGQGRSNPVLRVGGAADGFPAALVTGWRVLGSSQGFSNQTTSVFVAPLRSRGALDTLAARLQASGWTAAPAETGRPRGFLPVMGPAGQPIIHCLGADHFWATASSRQPDESQVVAIITRRTTSGPCSPAAAGRRPAPAAVPEVVLRVPADVYVQATVDSGGGSEWRNEAIAQGNTLVRTLAAHFHGQMLAQGWVAADSLVTAPFESRSYRKEAGDRRWEAVLTVSNTGPGMPTALALITRAVR